MSLSTESGLVSVMWWKVRQTRRPVVNNHGAEQQTQVRRATLLMSKVSIGGKSPETAPISRSIAPPQAKRLREWRLSLSTLLPRRRTEPTTSLDVGLTSAVAPHLEPKQLPQLPGTNTEIEATNAIQRSASSMATAVSSSQSLRRSKVQSLSLEQKVLHRQSASSAQSGETLYHDVSSRTSSDSLADLEIFHPNSLRAYTPSTICEVLEASRASSNLEREDPSRTSVHIGQEQRAHFDHHRVRPKPSRLRTERRSKRSASVSGHLLGGEPLGRLANRTSCRSVASAAHKSNHAFLQHRRITSA